MSSLADQVFAALSRNNPSSPPFVEPAERRRINGRYRDLMRNAKRFYLDEEATRAAAIMGYQHPDVLVAFLSRARTPFEKVWFEWPLAPALDEVGIEKDEMAPDRVGAVVERLDPAEPIYRMTMIYAHSSMGTEGWPSPISILFHLTQPLKEAARGGGEAANIIRRHSAFAMANQASKTVLTDVGFLLGSAYTNTARNSIGLDEGEAEYRATQCESLAAHAKMVYSPAMGEAFMRRVASGGSPQSQHLLVQSLIAEALEQAGTWRMVISILALINARTVVTADQPHKFGQGRRFVSGQVVPFLEHLLVKLKLPRKQAIQRVMREVREGIPKRRHEVMGHWRERHNSGDAACDHVWVDTTATNQKCAICERRRWFVNEFGRGTAEIGFVLKDRLVTRS